MEIVRIRGMEDPLFESFKEIYSVSFPIYEQRTEIQQCEAFEAPEYHLDGYVESGILVGFISYWMFDTYIYVEHFAIHPDRRGGGFGGFILQNLIDKTQRRIVLEIDPVIDSVSSARFHFYQRFDFSQNNYRHTHPAYRKDFLAHSLIVLSTQGRMTELEYQQFVKDLRTIVMKKTDGNIPCRKK